MRTGMRHVVAFAITLAACDGSSSPGESERDGGQRDANASHDMDAASHDASTRRDAAPSDDASIACNNEIGSCPAASSGKWAVLVDAADFGSGARLVATGGQVVVVAIEDGSYEVLRLREPQDFEESSPLYTSWPLSTGQLNPIAVTDESRSLFDTPPLRPKLFVLACDDAATHCSMFQTEVDDGELGPWQEDPLPEAFVAEGIVFDHADDARAPCVFGGGLLCMADGWQEAIAPSSNLMLRDVSIGVWSLAVGDHGRWFKRERNGLGELGAWEEQSRLEDVALTQTSVAGEGGVIVGDGRIVAAVGTQSEIYTCGVPKDIAAMLLDQNIGGLAFAVTTAGEVLQHSLLASRSEPYCSYEMRELGDILDTGYSPCDAGLNARVLTENVLWGQNQCIRLTGG